MTKVEVAVQLAIDIANDNSHGYDQGNRWGPDYDCSSLIITAYEKAGIPVKTAGATRTGDMYQAFIKCGFKEVQNWNRSTGAGLISGDVVLLPYSHVEMYVGDGKLVGAHINEKGGTHGGKTGDQGKEITVGNYYPHNPPWKYALRYTGNDQYTGDTSFLTSAYDYALSGVNVQPDYKEIDCFIITLDRNSPSVDYEKLKDIGVIGTIIELGSYFDSIHMENKTYKSPKLEEQVKAAFDNNIPYGFFVPVSANTIKEATDELSMLRIYASMYPPSLGIWLVLNFTKSKTINDSIIEYYRDSLLRAGYSGKMGFYVTRKQLEQVSWDTWKEDFLLMLNDHVSDISEIDTLLTPEFFMLNKR